MSLRDEAIELVSELRNLKEIHQNIKDEYMSEYPRKKVKVKNRDEMYDHIKKIVSKTDTTKSQIWDKMYKMKNELTNKEYLYNNLPDKSKNDNKNKTVVNYKKQKRLVEDISSIYDELNDYHWKLKSFKNEFLDRTEEDTGLTLKINFNK